MKSAIIRRLTPGAALLALSALFAAPSRAQDVPLAPGTRAPAFETTTLSGAPLSLKSLRGKVVLVDIWATWCGPCRMATPVLQGLNKAYSPYGLRVVGLSLDDDTTKDQVPQFVKYFGITYSVSASPEKNQRIASRYRSQGIPSQYLIDKKGIVRWSQSGYSPDEGERLSVLIRKLLAEKA
jgi:thiol-disulfide isomerase/thioredoxin